MVKRYNHVKLINEGCIDLDSDFTVEYGTEIPDCFTIKDVYGKYFFIPITSILYFYYDEG